MTPARQLPLPFTHQSSYDPADFVPDASNAEALAWLGRTGDWPDRRLLLWGGSGCGKTHLLRVWAARTGATLVAGPDLIAWPDVPSSSGIAIDDADHAAEETALLHLLNAARDLDVPVLLASGVPPARWPIRLPDLASRLRAVTAVQIGAAEPALLRALLTRLLADRQLRVDDAMQAWLLKFLPTNAGALRDAVAQLDQALLGPGVRLSRAMVVRAFAAGEAGDDSETIANSSSSMEQFQ
jgi:chromosomal replication initiation ATPase DnaA